jgi:hypothetical protein
MDKQTNPKEQPETKHPYAERDRENKIHFPEMSLDDLNDVLSLDVMHDFENKMITFFCFLSAYTHDSQINISFNAPSSSGKTYITTAIAKFFPDEDKIPLVRASPTALYYQYGEFDKERGASIVPMSRKIILFLEVPGPELQKNIRSLMSHDQWELTSLMTNKDKKGTNRASKVIFVGFPAIALCSAGLKLDEQEATRVILLSPEESEEKIRDSVHFTALKNAGNQYYMRRLEENPMRIDLKARILAIKAEHVEDILIPNIEKVEERFKQIHTKLRARHNRDLDHLCKLIKSIALLNIWNRRRANGSFKASVSDIDEAFRLWELVGESQDQNTPPALMRFYKQHILGAWFEKMADPDNAYAMNDGAMGLTRQELCNYYLRHEEQTMRDDYLRKQMLPQLEASGIITQIKPTDGDKRRMHIVPKWFPKDQNNIGHAVRKPENNKFIDPFDH